MTSDDAAVTYAQFIRELQELDPGIARVAKRARTRADWLSLLSDWAIQADSEARQGLPGDLESPDAMVVRHADDS